ncbi:outer membrane protein assembly factor BamB family protein [Halosimplex sp. J119]
MTVLIVYPLTYHMSMGDERQYTRRHAIVLAAGVAGTSLSGCLGGGSADGTPTGGVDDAAGEGSEQSGNDDEQPENDEQSGEQTERNTELSQGELNRHTEVAVGGSWPMDAYDTANTYSNPNGRGPGESVQLGWERGFLEVTRPVVADGRVFVGTKRQDDSGADRWDCKAFDAATGEEEWVTKMHDEAFPFPSYHDGSVYYFDDNGLKALDPATGDEQWHVGSNYGDLLHTDGTLYVVSGRYAIGDTYLTAIDTESHEVRWEQTSEEVALTESAGLADDGTIVAADVKALRAFDSETGEERWKRTFDEEDAPVDVSVAGDVALFTHNFESGTTAIEAVHVGSEEHLWTYSDDAIVTGMAVTGDRVYVGRDAEPGVAAIDLETGERIDDWAPDVGAAATYVQPGNARPRVAGETVYLWTRASEMGTDGTLHAIDAGSGAVRWSRDGELGFPPAVVEESLFYRETMAGDRLIALTTA